MKVVIADDDATARTLLKGLLGKWAFEIAVTEKGEEASASNARTGGARFVITMPANLAVVGLDDQTKTPT